MALFSYWGYEAYRSEFSLEKGFCCQTGEGAGTFEMILDFCVKFPNLNLIIYKKQECVDDEINKE